jgi:voltage-gated potassium channel
MDERSQRIEARFEIPLLIAAVLVIPVLIIEESNPGEPLRTIGAALNIATWLAFVAEVVVMLAVVPDRRLWIRKHPIEIIVTAFPPFLLAALAPVRALRLLRVLRLLRLAPLVRRLFTGEGVKFAALLAVITAVAGGAGFQAAEAQPYSLPNSIYWAITTMTTVGYGDIQPDTSTAKVIAVAVMLVGIGFVALVTGAIAERFLARDMDQVKETEDAIERTEEDLLGQVRAMSAQLAHLERALARQFAER